MSCNRCRRLRIAVPTVLTDIITLAVTDSMVNDMEKICFRLCGQYASPSPTVPVDMILNDDKVPLVDRLGRPIYSNQLRTRCIYESYYVLIDDVPHLTVMNVPLGLPSDCCECGR